MSVDTVGNFYHYYDECACCHMDTGGNHKGDCPLRYPFVPYRTYAEFGRDLEVQIEAHPEWRKVLI